MNVGVLGTGTVGRAIARKLHGIGHAAMIGTRDVAATLASDQPDGMGNPPFRAWYADNATIPLGTFREAALFGEILVNCTSGSGSLAALNLAGSDAMAGKVLIDIANPLDFSHGMPPTLTVCNTDSLAEQIQRTYPDVRVVKTLNTMTAAVMVNPGLIEGEHDVFVSGNDASAKALVTTLLREGFGWKSAIDLGGIQTARGAEMILPMWLNLMGVFQTPFFNFKAVR